MLDWLAETYVDALNVIHYMHDKYAYERLEMALHDYPVHRVPWPAASPGCRSPPTACRRSSTPRSSRSATTTGLVVDYAIDGDFPTYGNNDDRADAIAVWLVETFMDEGRASTRPTATPSTPSRC